MQLLNTLSILAVVNLVAAAPAPTHEKIVFDKTDPWYLVGYDKPNCEGAAVWNETGDMEGCRDVPRLAASYLWRVSQSTFIATWPAPQQANIVCSTDGSKPDPEAMEGAMLEAAGPGREDAGTMMWGCVTAPVHGFGLEELRSIRTTSHLVGEEGYE